MTFKPRRWALVMSGDNVTEAIQVVAGKFEYRSERFAIKGHKRALQSRSPSYQLMLLLLKPRWLGVKRTAVNDICDSSAKFAC